MLSQVRRGNHQEFDGSPMSSRKINGHGDRWKSPDRINTSFVTNNILPDVYPQSQFAQSSELSRAFRVDAHLLAIVRIEDKRNSHYATEVMVKLKQKEQTQSFINKPCSLFITERSFVIFDRGAQVIAETIPLENLDPTCVYSEGTGTLNDIFMYRLFDRNLTSRTGSQASNSTSQEFSSVIVFKCLNKDSIYLVDQIRSSTGKPLKNLRSARSEARSTIDRRTTDVGGMSFYDPHQQLTSHEHSPIIHPTHTGVTTQHTSRTNSHQHSVEYYKQLTEELNKCFDDIELFVRYLESLVEYTKELERDHRRKDKKSANGLKHMIEKIPDDRYFIDILQKFKHSFNLLGELKHIIHNPNAPELVHYLLTPLQFIVYTLRSKHPQQLQIAQDISLPGLTKEARELLINCLTSKEHEILRNLGPTWFRTIDETPQKHLEYRPIFFEGQALWLQESPASHQPIQSARTTDERQSSAWPTTRSNPIPANNTSQINPSATLSRQPSPAPPFQTSTIDRTGKSTNIENFNAQMQNEHAWAIERKRTGAKIYVVKSDRQGHNSKELTVRRGELIEIESNAKKWWRARNFKGEVGHVPHNIVEEIEIEQRPIKPTSTNPSAFLPRSSSAPNREIMGMNDYRPYHADNYPQYLLRSPSHGNNFIMQSTNSTATPRNQFYQQSYSPSTSARSSPPPPPPPAIPPPPPPPPLPADLFTSRSSPWSTLKLPMSGRRKRSNTNPNDSSEQVDEFQQELTQRITDRVGLINQNSSRDDVQRWLMSKNISSRLAQNLQGMNGEEIFQLSKDTLDHLTDPNESARVFSLLSQQKKLSGYRSRDMSEPSPVLNHSAFNSLKSNTINDTEDNFSFRLDDTLTRSLKIKLKQRRDKIEQAEPVDRLVL